jgi:hypothetical protein
MAYIISQYLFVDFTLVYQILSARKNLLHHGLCMQLICIHKYAYNLPHLEGLYIYAYLEVGLGGVVELEDLSDEGVFVLAEHRAAHHQLQQLQQVLQVPFLR